jgi:hypothetical protein
MPTGELLVKTVQNVKNSLKFKAHEKEGVLTIKVGVRKYAVPVRARMLSGQQYLFLSFPASSELYQVTAKELTPLDKESDASEAYEALNPGKRRGRRRSSGVDMPDDLAEALKNLAPGLKLGYNADGSAKLVRTRRRSKV